MNIEKEYLESHEVKLTVTVDEARYQRALKDAARKIARQANIPGFRKGKAPYRIIAQYFGEGAIIEEALDPLGQAVYSESLEEADIDPFAPGALTDIGYDPLTLTFTVPLRPKIELGEYRSVRVPYEHEDITDEDVEHQLEHLRESQATLETIEEPVTTGRVASLDIKGVIREEDEDFIEQEGARVLIDDDSTYPVPGFAEKIVGMEAGEERSFEVTIAEDDDVIAEELRGKTLTFDVTCTEVFSYDLPELDDELAKSIGDYETLAELRDAVRKDLAEEARRASRDAYLDEVFEALQSIVTVSYPPVLLEDELDRMLEDYDERLRNEGLTLNDYLTINDMSEDALREEFSEGARERIRRGLIMGEMIEAEQLEITDEEIDDEIQTMILSFGADASFARQLFGGSGMRNQIRNRLMTDKVLDRLMAIARGSAPELGAAPVEEDTEPAESAEDSANDRSDTDEDSTETALEAEADSAESEDE